MRTTILFLVASLGISTAFASEESCKINLWDNGKRDAIVNAYKVILTQKGYEPVYDDSAELSLAVSQAGFAETGCNDGGFFGDKNFKRVNACAEIRAKGKVIDSILGADIQTESTNFNSPKVKRISCATLDGALLNVIAKVPNCAQLQAMLSK